MFATRRKQAGVTFVGLFTFIGFVLFCIWIGFKIVPAYYQYYSVQKMLENIAADYAKASDREMRQTLEQRLDVSFIEEVKSEDLKIDRRTNPITLSVPIYRCSPVVHQVSLCVDLEATAQMGEKSF
jgi:Tfp pilus assembly protein PilO